MKFHLDFHQFIEWYNKYNFGELNIEDEIIQDMFLNSFSV